MEMGVLTHPLSYVHLFYFEKLSSVYDVVCQYSSYCLMGGLTD